MLSARTSFAALTTEFALQTRRVCRGRAFRVGFRKPNARNGTQPEPRLRIILFTFETRRSVGERNSWKISNFRKLEIEPYKPAAFLLALSQSTYPDALRRNINPSA